MGVGSVGLDHDEYNGDWADFAARFGLEQPIPPPNGNLTYEQKVDKLWDAHPELH
jgi:hypothetical protein